MSFNFSNINPINKVQSTYKDGGGNGGGGMYMNQEQKRKKDEEEDIFEFSKENDSLDEAVNFKKDIKEEDIPKDNYFNKFVNWFRLKR